MARADKSAASLAPGFRFHPTDEELIRYYLKRKVTNKPFRLDPIAVIDIYKSEPWDLPDKSKLKSRDLEWYFFSVLDKKYSNGSKTNRATEKGYWKTTGKDRPVRWNSRTVGMRKTLVYHLGRAPRGGRTNWVMHEYRLTDEDLEKAGVVQDAFVLCRIFQKSGTGPKNGEHYGAPFVEEEWDDDEVVGLLPGEEMVVTDDTAFCDEAYVETNYLDQNVDGAAPGITALPMNYCHGEPSNYVEHFGNFGGDDLKPIIDNLEAQYVSDLPSEQNLFILPGPYEIDAKSVRHEYIAKLSNSLEAVDDDYLLDEPLLDATSDPPFVEGFLTENDMSNPVETDSIGDSTVFDMVDEYLSFFDADDGNLTFDPSELMGSETAVYEQAPLPEQGVNGGTEEVPIAIDELLDTPNSADASSSKQQKPEAENFEPDMKYPFMKKASHMLSGIPAPPAFSSEFPIKGTALQLNAAQSSSSIRVTAGMIRIENITFGGDRMEWSFGKNRNVNITLFFAMSEENASLISSVPMANVSPGKTWSVTSWGWLLLMFFWVLILSVSYKIGTCISAK